MNIKNQEKKIFNAFQESEIVKINKLTYFLWLKPGSSLVKRKPGMPPCSTAYCRFEAWQCSPRKNYAPLRRQADLNRGTSLYD